VLTRQGIVLTAFPARRATAEFNVSVEHIQRPFRRARLPLNAVAVESPQCLDTVMAGRVPAMTEGTSNDGSFSRLIAPAANVASGRA
jgi:hypothetical protein